MRAVVQARSPVQSQPAVRPRRTMEARPVSARSGTGCSGWSYASIAVSAGAPPRLQRKLTVGSTADPLEHEAERVADKLMRMPDPHPAIPFSSVGADSAGDVLRRTCAACAAHEDEAVACAEAPSGDKIRRSPNGPSPTATNELEQRLRALDEGRPLAAAERGFFEPRLGHDLSHVRVHADSGAHSVANAAAARAFTVGRDIVFARGEYAPDSAGGRHLLAHELTHVVQQRAVQPLAAGAYSLRLRSDGGERVIGPPMLDAMAPGGEMAAPAQKGEDQKNEDRGDEGEVEAPVPDAFAAAPMIQRMPLGGQPWLQRTASFTKPTPQPRDPLARLVQDLTPGLTTPTINGNKITNDQDVMAAITPTSVTQTSTAAGKVTCEVSGLKIDTSAEQIVASAPAAGGWTARMRPDQLANPSQCGKVAQVPVTMNALPSNADFVKRVQASEDEHVTEIHALHDRYLVPYDRFIAGLSGTGADLNACDRNLLTKLNFRHRQATLAFVYGYAAATEKLDGPGGTHEDSAVVNAATDCASATITLSQSHPAIAGAGPGNVVPVAPTVTNFDPKKLRAVGNDLKDDKKTVKSFSSAANAAAALAVIRQYGMTSRNVIGAMEYFLVGSAAPIGSSKGVNQNPFDPARIQVSLNLPSANNWAITDISTIATGLNVNVIVNFGAARNEAYSGLAVIQSLGFTRRGWIGGTREAPEMMYFTT